MKTVVLLGASNLWNSLPWAVAHCQSLEVEQLLVACGPGRSFATRAGTPVASFPGILQCELFDVLEGEGEASALITDIGNDLIYAQTPRLLAGWISEVLDRLQSLGVTCRLTELPLTSIERLPPWFYYLFRGLYYPGSKVTHEEMMERLQELNQMLLSLCRRRQVELLPALPQWYSLDRFHLSPWKFEAVWSQWLGGRSNRPCWRAYLFEPRRYWFFGRPRQGRPSFQLGQLRVLCF